MSQNKNGGVNIVWAIILTDHFSSKEEQIGTLMHRYAYKKV